MEIRAHIGISGSDLALAQGCSCLVSKDECLVHGKVDAFCVHFTYIGRKRVIPAIHVNSFLMVPIKEEVKFYRSLYKAVGKANQFHSQGHVETVIFIRENGELRELTDEELEEVSKIEKFLEFETAGI